jgi:hypothetical protein
MRLLTLACSLMLTLFLFFISSVAIHAQTTAFNYQGKLTDASAAANGAYDLQFALYDSLTGGIQIGTPQTLTGVIVSKGVFTAELDFGNVFPGANRYLEIRVKKPGDESYTTLDPRQLINSVPYAVRSLNAANVESATAGNSVVNAINNAATNVTINGNRLPADIVRIKPDAAQNSTTGANGADAMVNIRGIYGQQQSNFRINHDGGLFSSGAFVGSSFGRIPAEGEGTRLMWYPEKAAFRAGYVSGTQWDDGNIGNYSVAIGENVRASGINSTAFGKSNVAANNSSFAVGENNVASGSTSVALGYQADTNSKTGSFVFSDRFSLNSAIRATVPNQFVVRAQTIWLGTAGAPVNTPCGSIGLSCTDAANIPGAFLTTSTGAFLTTGGTWTNASSRALKANFAPVDSRSILQKVLTLPIQTWNYKAEGESVRHIGAISQDFRDAFNLGNSAEAISTVDADGVALAAIQGLNEELKTELKIRDAKIEKQQQQIDALIKLVCSQNTKAEVCKQEK